jgi:hypothetical protein
MVKLDNPMSPAPQAPEEEPVPPATMRYISSVSQLARKEISAEIASAIREFKRELETAQRDREIAESSKRLDRSVQWSIRFVSGAVGAAIMMFIVVAGSQCSDLHERIRTLESNQSKTK